MDQAGGVGMPGVPSAAQMRASATARRPGKRAAAPQLRQGAPQLLQHQRTYVGRIERHDSHDQVICRSRSTGNCPRSSAAARDLTQPKQRERKASRTRTRASSARRAQYSPLRTTFMAQCTWLSGEMNAKMITESARGGSVAHRSFSCSSRTAEAAKCRIRSHEIARVIPCLRSLSIISH